MGVIRLAGEALLQLAVGSGERALVLRDGILLEGQPPFQRGELRAQADGGLLKAINPRGGQLELALRLRDLLVHRADVSREVIRLQRQRHHQIPQRFAHVRSPANRIKINGDLSPLNLGLNLSAISGIMELERS